MGRTDIGEGYRSLVRAYALRPDLLDLNNKTLHVRPGSVTPLANEISSQHVNMEAILPDRRSAPLKSLTIVPGGYKLRGGRNVTRRKSREDFSVEKKIKVKFSLSLEIFHDSKTICD